MFRQSAFNFSWMRLLFVSSFALLYIVLVSEIVTAIGSHSTLANRTSPPYSQTTNQPQSSDALSGMMSGVVADVRDDSWRTARFFYKTAQSVSGDTRDSGKILTQTGRDVGVGLAKTGVFTLSIFSKSGSFTFHMMSKVGIFLFTTPGKVIGVASTLPSNGTILEPSRPSSVPVINQKLADAKVASLFRQAQQTALSQQQLAEAQAAQLSANKSLQGVVLAGDPSHGGYPASLSNAPKDSLVDNWGMFNRECVSYAAWKVYQTYGSMPYWGGEGNANEWPADAEASGIPLGAVPKVHSVAISMYGYYGHAMWVEAVDGNMIYVSQYNYDMQGHYSEMWVNGSGLTYIYFN